MKRIVALAALTLLLASGANARSNKQGDVWYISWVALATDSTLDTLTVDGVSQTCDSTGLTLDPTYTCEYLGWDMVKYMVNDGPCTIFVYAIDKEGYSTDTTGLQSTDTLVVPFPGLNIGAQGSVLPVPGYWPMELEKVRIKPAGLIDYLVIYWPGRKPIW